MVRDPNPSLEPLSLSKKQAFKYVGIPSLVQDWLYASRHAQEGERIWVEIVQEGGRGRETRIDKESIDQAYKLFKQGIRPPKVPSKQKKGEKKSAPPRSRSAKPKKPRNFSESVSRRRNKRLD